MEIFKKNRQRVDGPTNTCGASEVDIGDRDGENADTTSAGPQLQEGTTHTQGEKLPPGPKDLSQLPDSGRTCPDLKRYPATEYSGQSKSFNKNWRNQFTWLEYSVTQDAAFCFACRLFSHTHFSKTEKYLLDMISRYDEIVKKKLSGPGNAKYTHHDIQNELLDIITGMIRKDTSKEVMETEHFALMVDETKDVSKQEQLSIVVRYLHQQSLHEKFLGFTAAEGLDADSLLKKIMETLAKCGIDNNACIGQCYDRAAVMSGHICGVQERFRREVSQAVYVHCYAHRLNLC
ncbi:52 kDa repressor of the inhibitor of the protein kinase-like [Tachypleus tridentatus]|uniref:52 kDa repressor of the inhibitor of the protein kinase-like n=1 Tax=Tachypleus tridentatus TaxID=6853 RepID=UPI003FD4E415